MHLIYVGRLSDHVAAVALEESGGLGKCVCDVCEMPDNELERARAELACNLACAKKCPAPEEECPIERFTDESDADYQRRCQAAIKLNSAAEANPAPAPEDDGFSPEDAW